jgi:hypothetical protein
MKHREEGFFAYNATEGEPRGDGELPASISNHLPESFQRKKERDYSKGCFVLFLPTLKSQVSPKYCPLCDCPPNNSRSLSDTN